MKTLVLISKEGFKTEIKVHEKNVLDSIRVNSEMFPEHSIIIK